MISFRPGSARLRQARIVLICFFTALLVLGLERAWPPFAELELRSLDWRFQRRGPRRVSSEVVLVTIDEQSLADPRLHHWPWRRSVYGRLIDVLRARGAAVIAFDIGFFERQDAHEDAAFAAAVRRAGNVLLAGGYIGGAMGTAGSAAQEAPEMTLDRIRASDALRATSPPAPVPPPAWLVPSTRELLWSLPLPELVAAARGVGAVNIDYDPDGIYRRVAPAWLVDNGRLYPHLAVLAAALKLGVAPHRIRVDNGRGRRTPDTRPALLLADRRTIPLSDDGTFLIDYPGPPLIETRPRMFPRYSVSEVLRLDPAQPGRGKEPTAGGIGPEAFRGKVVFVGAVAAGLNDQRPSPYSHRNTGVETNAGIADAILQDRFFTSPAPLAGALLLLGAGLLAGGLLGLRSLLGGTLLLVLAAIAYAAVSLALFRAPRVVLPVTGPLVTMAACSVLILAYRFQGEYRERLRGRAYLDLYVSRPVADRILSDPRAAALGGQIVEVTVLFADIRGFTPLTESLPAPLMMALLNEYFEGMVAVIMAHEGTLVHYAGDMIMAVWGAPIAHPDHARRAVLAGIEMLDALRQLQADWRARGLPVFDIGIGLNSGEALAGNVGGTKRRQYAVIGDTTNTAARLETLNKEMETAMIISEATFAQVEDLVTTRPLGSVTVKGKSQPVTVYEVLGRKSATDARTAPRHRSAVPAPEERL
jgi:adenylate cyclase